MRASTTMATDHLRRAAVRATWAHSVYHTQPWRLRLDAAGLHLYVDRSRQLNVVDPASRLMTISMGCALLNARVSMAADGVASDVERFPSTVDPDLVATLRIGGAGQPELAALDGLLESRYFDQRLFFDDTVPDTLLDTLREVVAAEGAEFVPLGGDADRQVVSALSVHADTIENLNPAYRAEVRAWTQGARERVSDLPAATDRSAVQPFLALLCTADDTPHDWLRAGEALERALLEIARAGFASRVLLQVTEVPSVRSQLRRELALTSYPHVLVRIGRAPTAPMPGRRRLVDVLTESR